MPVFRKCNDPPPWEAERTSSRPVHARLAKRVAEKAARKLFAKKYRETGAARVGRERWPDLARGIEDAEKDKK